MTGHADIFGKTLARYTFLRRDQYEISDKILLRKFLLRGGDLGNRPGVGEKRPFLATFYLADQIVKYRLVPCRGADQRNILKIHDWHVQRQDRAGNDI